MQQLPGHSLNETCDMSHKRSRVLVVGVGNSCAANEREKMLPFKVNEARFMCGS